jgi:hypothetical protein
MLKWLKKRKSPWKVLEIDVKIYPSPRGCIRDKMDTLKPEQLPPRMVRKAAWRRD